MPAQKIRAFIQCFKKLASTRTATIFLFCTVIVFVPIKSAHAQSINEAVSHIISPDSSIEMLGSFDGPEIESFIIAGEERNAGSHQLAPAEMAQASAVLATSTEISIVYNTSDCRGTTTAWPSNAATALEQAAEVWEGLINSTVEIVVVACWRTDLNNTVIGSASTRTYDGGFFNAPVGNTFYPNALANAIIGDDPFPSIPEVRANFNANLNWYFDPNGVPAANQYDLTTVAIRNLAHGLGFSGTAYVANNMGYWGFPAFSRPMIFDHFTEDGAGQSITNYSYGSEALGNALQGGAGGLFFNGPNTLAANGGNPAPLNAPSIWDNNASHDFLDDSFDGTADDLMTHTLSPGQFFRTLGPVTVGILADIGWPQPSRVNMTESLGSFSYDPIPEPDAQLGTLSITFNFQYVGTSPLSAVKVLVTTSNQAKLKDSYPTVQKTFIGDGGVGTLMHVPNDNLPDANNTPAAFNGGETLAIPFNILINSAPWGLNFELYASNDSLTRAASLEPLLRFSLDSSMIDVDYVQPQIYLPFFGQ